MIAPLLGALASAALLGLYARLEGPSWLLGFVVLVPWILGLGRARGLGAALASAVVLACGMAVAAFSWFPPAVAGYAGGSPVTGWVVLVAVAPFLLEPQFVAAAAARHLVARRAGAGAAAAVAVLVYTGAEWALPKLFADTLGVGLYPQPALRQAAELAGVRGLTVVLLVANEAIAALARRRPAPALLAAALTAATFGFGALRLAGERARIAAAPVLRAGIIQANITTYDKLAARDGTFAAVAAILETHLELSERLLDEGPLDVLVWPETTYPTTFGAPRTEDAAAFDRAIAGLPARRRVPLILGAFEADGAGEYNALFVVSPTAGGVELDSYRKSLLFPMTERVPPWLDGPWLRRRLPWAGRWQPGPGPRALPVVLAGRALALGPLICYEVTDTAYVAATARAGADLLVTLSNDAWFTSPDGPRLHLLTAAFRSVETRRPQLRATNSGMSALVLPTGDLVAATAFGARAAFRVDVPLVAPVTTLVVRWGDWLGAPSLVLGLLLTTVITARRRATTRKA